jgi:4-hydroxy-3-methylbut-2-enyl diphosphate reductase
MSRALVIAPGAVGYAAVRAGCSHSEVVRRPPTVLQPGQAMPPTSVAVVGFGRALAPDLVAGTVIVATEVRNGPAAVALPSANALAAAMIAAGLTVRTGPIVSADHPLSEVEARGLAEAGALAVDTESAELLSQVAGDVRAVVRVIVDGDDRALPRIAVPVAALGACRTLRRVASVLDWWGNAVRPRRVLLAGPRSFCAGVERAVRTVELALDRYGAPLYVRRQIVHNRLVVERLTRQGAVFVEELDEVPDGATVVFSAHGVAPAVHLEAQARNLQVIDATCPLVAKVHAEVRRFRRDDYEVMVIGHAGHDEIEGTMGESDHLRLLGGPEDVGAIDVAQGQRVAFVTQTTLALDEVAETVTALRARFPDLVGPRSDDVCYATQNRQDAVRAMAEDCDLMIVVGSTNSSNTNRLVEVSLRSGCPAILVDDASELDVRRLAEAGVVGVTAGASAPPELVEGVLELLAGLGPIDRSERSVADETLYFSLPQEVR